PVTAVAMSNCRRLRRMAGHICGSVDASAVFSEVGRSPDALGSSDSLISLPPCCAMHCTANALVCAAAAEVARESGVDVGIGRLGVAGKQGRCRHQLPGLAITTLRTLFGDPRALKRRAAVGREALNRRHRLIAYGGDGNLARTLRFAVEVYGT